LKVPPIGVHLQSLRLGCRAMSFFPGMVCCFCGRDDYDSIDRCVCWTSQLLVVKNSFLEVEDPLAESCRGFQVMRRQTTDPVCSPGVLPPQDSMSRSPKKDVRESLIAEVRSAKTTGNTLSPSKAATCDTFCSMEEQNEEGGQGMAEPLEPSYSEPLLDQDQDLPEAPHSGHQELPSIGSAMHLEQACKPCAFLNTQVGCKYRSACRFCHFEHTSKRQRVRPCRGKRERIKKLIGRLMHDMDASAVSFQRSGKSLDAHIAAAAFLDSVTLPAMIQDNAGLKEMVFSKMKEYASQAFEGQMPL